jgi:tripartite-type tricarboxylate transporter receptor subunit TctC
MRPGRAIFAAIVGILMIGFAVAASAQPWPSHQIRVISPFVTGTTNDLIAQTVLDQAGRLMGQSFALENRPGGDGTAGVESVVRSAPDGYTLLLSSSSLSASVILHKTLPYDIERDLQPVAMLGGLPDVLIAAPPDGFKTLADLVAAAKDKPGKLKFASVGAGSASHIAAETFLLAAGLDVQHVPYGGPVQALDDLQAGRIDFYFVPVPPAVPLIAQGKVVALAVSTAHRSLLLPGVPTMKQAGYAMPEYLIWDGLMAPAKTSPEIVATLNAAVNKALALPPIREKLQRYGVETKPMSTQDFAEFFAADVAAMKKLGGDTRLGPAQ